MKHKYVGKEHDCLYRILFEALEGAHEKERLGSPYVEPLAFGPIWEVETERYPETKTMRGCIGRATRAYLRRDEESPVYILHLPDKGEPMLEKLRHVEE